MKPLSAKRIAADVRAGKTSSVETAKECLARVAAYQAIQPQTWILRCDEKAVLAHANKVDARIKAGENLPLAGAPFAVKDNIDVAGLPTTAACPPFAYPPNANAFVVQRLIDAGAILIGKTNMDQFATGLVGARSPHGAPGCVFNRDYISGGSSSGSAVATAAGLVAFALGTDTAGSGRVPAAFNNLIGLKPTKGRWSTSGIVPACRSLDCVSVFTHDCADAALIDSVLAEFDPADPYSRRAQAGLKSVTRLGIPKPDQLAWFGDAQSEALFAAARAAAAKLEIALIEVDLAPMLECARLLYQGPWVAERAVAMAGILKSAPNAIDPAVRAIVQAGAHMSAIDAFEGFYALKRFERDAEELWTQVEALLLPTAPTIYRIAEVRAEPFALNANLGLYTNFVNLLDMAAIAVPAGFRDNATGFGVSFIGPAWSESALFKLAAKFHAAQNLQAPALDLSPRAPKIQLAVVGAHLAGMPLHWQLTSRNARFVRAATTAPVYKLFALETTPPKPALIHVGKAGGALELEIYELDEASFGSFTAEVPAPLAIGTVDLEDGSSVRGFVAEPRAAEGAKDITHLGGWRAYIAQRNA